MWKPFFSDPKGVWFKSGGMISFLMRQHWPEVVAASSGFAHLHRTTTRVMRKNIIKKKRKKWKDVVTTGRPHFLSGKRGEGAERPLVCPPNLL